LARASGKSNSQEYGGGVGLGVGINQQDAPAVGYSPGQTGGQVNCRRGFPGAALLIGDGNHSCHRVNFLLY
jgi:hypothetical protein